MLWTLKTHIHPVTITLTPDEANGTTAGGTWEPPSIPHPGAAVDGRGAAAPRADRLRDMFPDHTPAQIDAVCKSASTVAHAAELLMNEPPGAYVHGKVDYGLAFCPTIRNGAPG